MAIFFPHNSFLAARAVHDGLAVLIPAAPHALLRQWARDDAGRLAAGWHEAAPDRHLPVAGAR